MHSSPADAAGNASAIPVLDLDACRALGPDGQRVEISPAQLALLLALAHLSPDEVLPWRAAIAAVYGVDAARDPLLYLPAIQAVVSRLRGTLHRAGWHRPPFEVARYYGLRLTVAVAVVKRRPDGTEPLGSAPQAGIY